MELKSFRRILVLLAAVLTFAVAPHGAVAQVPGDGRCEVDCYEEPPPEEEVPGCEPGNC